MSIQTESTRDCKHLTNCSRGIRNAWH
ncbi:DUF3265 domain-containing protein, partial [Vibrio parahaemolyticus]